MAGTTPRPPSLQSLCDRDKELALLLKRRAGQPRAEKVLSVASRALLGAVVSSASDHAPDTSPALFDMLIQGRSGTTWDRYAAVLRPWAARATASGVPALPADPHTFAEWLAEAGAHDAGYTQTKMRCVAMAAVSDLAGVASPTTDRRVIALRAAARRSKCGSRRGGAAPVLPSSIPLPPLAPADVGAAAPPEGGPALLPNPADPRVDRRSALTPEGRRRREIGRAHV